LLQAVGSSNTDGGSTATLLTVDQRTVEDYMRKECIATWYPDDDAKDAKKDAVLWEVTRQQQLNLALQASGIVRGRMRKRAQQEVSFGGRKGDPDPRDDGTIPVGLTARAALMELMTKAGRTDFERGIPEDYYPKKGRGSNPRSVRRSREQLEKLLHEVGQEKLDEILMGDLGDTTIQDVPKEKKVRKKDVPTYGSFTDKQGFWTKPYENSFEINVRNRQRHHGQNAADKPIFSNAQAEAQVVERKQKEKAVKFAARAAEAKPKEVVKKEAKATKKIDISGNPDISILPGVGRKRADKLRDAGLATITELAKVEDSMVQSIAKEHGLPSGQLMTWIKTSREALADAN